MTVQKELPGLEEWLPESAAADFVGPDQKTLPMRAALSPSRSSRLARVSRANCGNRDEAVEGVIDADRIVAAVRAVVATLTGNASDILGALGWGFRAHGPTVWRWSASGLLPAPVLEFITNNIHQTLPVGAVHG